MGRKPKEWKNGKKPGKYLRRREIRMHRDKVISMLKKLLSYFKGNTKEIKMEGLTGLIKAWDKGCHSEFLRWLKKKGAVEDLGWITNSCFGERFKIMKLKKQVLKKLFKIAERSRKEYIVIYSK